VREYVSGLVTGLERTNGWTLVKRASEVSPDGMQRLLRLAGWDVDRVRDDVRDYVIEWLGDREGVLIADERGRLTAGVGNDVPVTAVYRPRSLWHSRVQLWVTGESPTSGRSPHADQRGPRTLQGRRY
jgi:hypothetical protein